MTIDSLKLTFSLHSLYLVITVINLINKFMVSSLRDSPQLVGEIDDENSKHLSKSCTI